MAHYRGSGGLWFWLCRNKESGLMCVRHPDGRRSKYGTYAELMAFYKDYYGYILPPFDSLDFTFADAGRNEEIAKFRHPDAEDARMTDDYFID